MKWNFGVLKCFGLCLAFCGVLSLLQFLAACSPASETKTTKGNTVMQTQTITENNTPFACNMAALNHEQKKRVLDLLKELKTKRQEVVELPDGYAFRFAMDSDTFKNAAEFITLERLCCPFFEFELAAEKADGAMWLRLKGREGVKDFIKTEFDL